MLSIRTSIGQDGAKTWEKDTKTHQQRRIALDEATVTLLKAYRQQCDGQAKQFGRKLVTHGRLFSSSVDHSTWLRPDSIGQRYRRMCTKLGWDMNIHQLRHYSATELISSGVDARTVAGRLGHGGGGATTLRVYSAWVAEADQRAAGNLGARMPTPPVTIEPTGAPLAVTEERDDAAGSPYRKIAADLQGAITSGALRPGDQLPTVADLASRYGVAAGTAQRALTQLRSARLISVSRGRRAIVTEHLTRAGDERIAEVVPLPRSPQSNGDFRPQP
ncbi:MAG: GntR family transcriptional regulator [Actinobacteria bacterium]|nr:GntR family transcriptional regulator [Actinomycetota bacterium]